MSKQAEETGQRF